MDVAILSRLQFAFTIGFHYLFPPLSIGLGVILVIMEGMYLRTKNPLYEQMTKFWVKVFALIFGVGVATGIVMEFQFGTNWAVYSRYVGDVFGSALAAEGIFAFFLESGFLALLVFGWDKVKPRTHFIATCLVAFGAHFSAIWIVIANSWQQTPAGFHIVTREGITRAEVTDFAAVLFNPSTFERLSHTILGAWIAAAFLVISVAAFYMLKKKHIEFARTTMKIGIVFAITSTLLQLLTGHASAQQVAFTQPAKLAAFEGHYNTSPTGLFIMGWVDDENQTAHGIKIPGMLSWLVYMDASKPVTGLNEFKKEDRPPVQLVFQSFHLMVGIGMALILISGFAFALWKMGKLENNKPFLWLLVFSVALPEMANQLGWMSAEVGRQPWIVYGLLRTTDAISKSVSANEIIFSLILFGLIYALLLALFIFLLDRKIKAGPEHAEEIESEYDRQRVIFEDKKNI